MTPREYKSLYAAERAALGAAGIAALFARAPDVALPARGAIVFPHAHLAGCGHFVAAAARAVVRSGAEEVLALGVLHGGRDEDRALVARARAGDERARAEVRRVHGPGTAGDRGMWTEEFSLDNFTALVDAAAKDAGVRAPRVVPRFPFLVGEHPEDLPGLDELRAAVARGAAVVATADPMHHGAGYATPLADRRPIDDVAAARARVEAGLALLAARDFPAFLAHAIETRSDFRDSGPALAVLFDGPLVVSVLDVALVDYAPTLRAPPPTWVATALAVLGA